MWFLFPPLATVWTCAFTCAQVVSYFSLLHVLCMIMILNVVSLSSTYYCVNLDINWFMSAGKLLFIWSVFICLISILYMIMVLNVVSLSSTCYCVNVCIHLCSGGKSLFTASYSMYDHDLECALTCYCVNVCIYLCSVCKSTFHCFIFYVSLIPRLSCEGGGKIAWYTLFNHA